MHHWLYRYVSFCFFLLLLSFPYLSSSRILQLRPASSLDDEVIAWRNFTKLAHAEKGRPAAGMADLKSYMHRFGYLSKPENGTINFTDSFDQDLQVAVYMYQANLGLPVTGKLDSTTINAITSPRCGVRDVTHEKSPFHVTKRFTYFAGTPRWNRKAPVTLTYSLSPNNTIDYLTQDEIKSALKRSFSKWSAVIPVTFSEAVTYRTADIRIGFYEGSHGDGEPFDGVLGVLGHAFSPEGGRLHLDKSEMWSVDFDKMKSKVAIDLESVVTHEIGHILGLAHSSVPEAVMYPSLKPRTKKVGLRVDDVEGIQALYGSNPNFSLDSLLESENSPNSGNCRTTRLSSFTRTAFSTVCLAFLLVALR